VVEEEVNGALTGHVRSAVLGGFVLVPRPVTRVLRSSFGRKGRVVAVLLIGDADVLR
jgi:hypothetical protein